MAKVEQKNAEFQPITITLESYSEMAAFQEILRLAYSNAPGGSDTERLAEDLRDKVGDGGWQSSSYNC